MSKSDVERIPCSDKNREKWHCTRKERSERRANTENRKDVVVKHSCLKRPRTAGERDSSKRNRDTAIQKKTGGGQMKNSEKANRKQQR